MLKTIIQHEPIDSMPRKDLAILVSIGSDPDSNLSGKPLPEKRDFIALRYAVRTRIRGSTIAAHQNCRLLPFLCAPLRNAQHQRGLARAADREVSNTYDCSRQSVCSENAPRVTPDPHAGNRGIKSGQRPKQPAPSGGALHIRPQEASINGAMWSKTRCVAPRFRSTNSRAEAPMRAARSGSLSKPRQADAKSSELPTSIAAPASRKVAAISRKFSMECP